MRLLIDTLRDLWSLLGPRGRWTAAALVVLLIVSGAFEMVGLLFLFGYFTALGAEPGTTPGMPVARFYLWAAGDPDGARFALAAGAVLIGVFLAKNLLGLATGFALMRFAMKRYQKVAARLFEAYLAAPYDRFLVRGALGPQQVLGSLSGVFRASFVPALSALSDIAIFLTMVLALMLVLDPWLVAAAGTVLGAGGALFLWLTRRLSMALGQRRVEAERALGRTVTEGFRGLLDLRTGNRLDTVVGRYAQVASEFAVTDRRARALDMTPRALNEMLLAGGIVVAALWFAQEEGGLAGALSSLAVLGFAGLRMSGAMSRLAGALQLMRQNQPARQRLMAALRETAPALLGRDGAAAVAVGPRPEPLPLEDRLAAEDVRYRYPGEAADGAPRPPALDGVSLTVRRGQLVGLCGPSGGGKSTLALVLMGLLRPEAGRVTADGRDIFENAAAWHAAIGHVGQTPFLPPGTVRDTVAFGERPEEVDDARVWDALEQARLADLVRARPGGLDARLGEDGAFVSGGQRQRLAIARALYRDPAVLVLDEATAALDTATESEITRAIGRLSGQRTVIAIAHRLTTLRDADAIHVVEAGRIAASGTFETLERESESFRQLLRGPRRAA